MTQLLKNHTSAGPEYPLDVLTPEGVAQYAAGVVAQHLGALNLALRPGPGILYEHVDLVRADIANGPWGNKVRSLVRYAQLGAWQGDLEDLFGGLTKVQNEVCEVLGGTPAGFKDYRNIHKIWTSSTPVGEVLRACRARQKLVEGTVPDTNDLSALVSLLPNQARYLMKHRVYLPNDVMDQRRFCHTRGVKGFEAWGELAAPAPITAPI